jgi:hypothetical protein
MRTEPTKYGVKEIAKLFPSLMKIKQKSLREKVAAVWNEAITTGCGGKGWTFAELPAVKFAFHQLHAEMDKPDSPLGHMAKVFHDPANRLTQHELGGFAKFFDLNFFGLFSASRACRARPPPFGACRSQ